MIALEILLAEDNQGDILLVQEALEEHEIHHRLHVVRDGEEALAFISRIGQTDEAPCPDLLLLDLNLPRVDGPDILSEFRKHLECANTPVVVITSSDADKDRARMAALGISRYFRKPSDLDAFLALGALVRDLMNEMKG
ncbi:MAG TPA: response regulator [Bryobacteraceae bacterium]|jgi:CheY-like chemotaxis protein